MVLYFPSSILEENVSVIETADMADGILFIGTSERDKELIIVDTANPARCLTKSIGKPIKQLCVYLHDSEIIGAYVTLDLEVILFRFSPEEFHITSRAKIDISLKSMPEKIDFIFVSNEVYLIVFAPREKRLIIISDPAGYSRSSREVHWNNYSNVSIDCMDYRGIFILAEYYGTHYLYILDIAKLFEESLGSFDLRELARRTIGVCYTVNVSDFIKDIEWMRLLYVMRNLSGAIVELKRRGGSNYIYFVRFDGFPPELKLGAPITSASREQHKYVSSRTVAELLLMVGDSVFFVNIRGGKADAKEFLSLSEYNINVPRCIFYGQKDMLIVVGERNVYIIDMQIVSAISELKTQISEMQRKLSKEKRLEEIVSKSIILNALATQLDLISRIGKVDQKTLRETLSKISVDVYLEAFNRLVEEDVKKLTGREKEIFGRLMDLPKNVIKDLSEDKQKGVQALIDGSQLVASILGVGVNPIIFAALTFVNSLIGFIRKRLSPKE